MGISYRSPSRLREIPTTFLLLIAALNINHFIMVLNLGLTGLGRIILLLLLVIPHKDAIRCCVQLESFREWNWPSLPLTIASDLRASPFHMASPGGLFM